MKNIYYFTTLIFILFVFNKCAAPPERDAKPYIRHNYIVLLDLSDRLIIEQDQPERDKYLVNAIYTAFEQKVRMGMYFRATDEIKVVIAPQEGSPIKAENFENDLYINMDRISINDRKTFEKERRERFSSTLDKLYSESVFSNEPDDYKGADIWKYFKEDINKDMETDSLTKNYLFLFTDGYNVVGNQQNKLLEVKDKYSSLNIMLLEATPREGDLEWDSVMNKWAAWFEEMEIDNFILEKRRAKDKTVEAIYDFLDLKIRYNSQANTH